MTAGPAAKIPDQHSIAARRGLLARIHRRYQTVTQQVQVGALRLEFTRIADPDRVLDEVAAEEDRREKLSGDRISEPLHLPYWAELWDSAMGIGQLMVSGGIKAGSAPSSSPSPCTQGEVKGEGFWYSPEKNPYPYPLPEYMERGQKRLLSVLDLGCGMGLAGTVAAALGAKVLFADLEPPALLLAKLNGLPFGSRVRARQLDWRSTRLDERFDLILGADILYERAQWQYLEPFWRNHLKPEGVVLLGEPGRQTGDLFIEWIGERPWELTQLHEKVATREKPIRIFHLAQKSTPAA